MKRVLKSSHEPQVLADYKSRFAAAPNQQTWTNFKSQRDRSWFTEDAFMSIMRIRGIESNSPHKYAEGFYCRKIVL